MAGFRTDVEGLRALAIGIVLLAHAGVAVAGGGYVGVDVFFVISGFLITRLLVGELERTGRVSLPRFYARRVKRLMPQALDRDRRRRAGRRRLLLSPLRPTRRRRRHGRRRSTSMNWRLVGRRPSTTSPPGRATARSTTSGRSPSRSSSTSCGRCCSGSLACGGRWLACARRWALIVVASLARTRCGASARGARAGVLLHRARARGSWRWAALLALWLAGRAARAGAPRAAAAGAARPRSRVATVAFGDGDAASRAPPALLPTLGAAALVAAGASATPAGPTRALALRPVRFVGRMSYAWYVWHWPALVFAAARLGPAVDRASGLAVVGRIVRADDRHPPLDRGAGAALARCTCA